MTMREIMRQYFMGEVDAISTIRMLSGMFNPDHAVTLLSLICTITRHEQGDIDTQTFNSVWKLGIDLEFKGGDYPEHYDKKTIEELTDELVEMQTKLPEPLTEQSPEEDHALDNDISLLTTYITYRMRKEELNSDE